jgi:succinate dehydrogenase flavin-adding protein (antitoxin of CptAB toxin-antitoxin module)
VLKQLDEELDKLLDGWQQTLLDNLDDPIIQANLDLLKASARELIKKFVASKKLADPVTPDFVSAVQEALSGLEKIGVSATTSRGPCCKADHPPRRTTCVSGSRPS